LITLKQLSETIQKRVWVFQAQCSTSINLPDEAFHMFPETGTSEVHLATGFQNIIFDSNALPADFSRKHTTS
jgi:hypothetical protein